MEYSEPELIIPTLRLLKENPNGLTMSKIIQALEVRLKPTGHDMHIIHNRKDTYFSQKVRNLKSHNTLTNKGFAEYLWGHTFRITPQGLKYLEDHEAEYDALMSQGFKPEDIDPVIEADFRDLIVEEGAVSQKNTTQRERSKKLRDFAVKEFKKRDGGKLICEACGFDFEEKYGELGKDYIEIHHKSPVHLMDVEGTRIKASEALGKLAPLCSNCHRMVHRKRDPILSPEELKTIIKDTAS